MSFLRLDGKVRQILWFDVQGQKDIDSEVIYRLGFLPTYPYRNLINRMINHPLLFRSKANAENKPAYKKNDEVFLFLQWLNTLKIGLFKVYHEFESFHSIPFF